MLNEVSSPNEVQEVAVRCPNCNGKAAIFVAYSFMETKSLICCTQCAYRKQHAIKWPADAYYKVEVNGAILWAWSRNHLVAIRDYIASEERSQHKYRQFSYWSIRKIPAKFTNVKRRATIVRAIDRLLMQT